MNAVQHESLNDEVNALRNVSACLFRRVFVCRTRQHLVQLCCAKQLIASTGSWLGAQGPASNVKHS